jgi:MFS family permease
MWVQASGVGVTAMATSFAGFAMGAVLLGVGTAMVYPTLLAAIGDVAHPSWRASSVGIYRLWRDLGYAIGAILAGAFADAFGLSVATLFIAALTFGSGLVVALRMRETLAPRHETKRPDMKIPEAVATTQPKGDKREARGVEEGSRGAKRPDMEIPEAVATTQPKGDRY